MHVAFLFKVYLKHNNCRKNENKEVKVDEFLGAEESLKICQDAMVRVFAVSSHCYSSMQIRSGIWHTCRIISISVRKNPLLD